MDERRNSIPDPWDDGFYETGRIRPPKRRSGFLAVFLVTIIFLSGVICALSILNIRLLDELSAQPEEASISMSFTGTDQKTPAFSEATASTEPEETVGAALHGDAAFRINSSPESADNISQEGGLSWQEIYKKVIPSVVSITCSTQNGTSSGTGVVFCENGYIVTNSHVVDGAFDITVLLTDERTFSARIIGSDAVSDLAVLYVDAEDLTAAEFGDSSALRVGDAVAAIGDPLGVEFRGTMTDGIISAINRDVTVDGRTMTLVQTNAALNSGNSGGPLVNCYGQVVGINTMKISAFTDDAGVEGLGFAIPSTTVAEIVDQLLDQGYVSGRPTLGLKGETLSTFYQHYYRMPAGLYLTEVSGTGPAGRVGIQKGDILISIDGTPVTDMDTLNSLLSNFEVGDIITVIIYRTGRQYAVQLTLEEFRG